MHFHEIGFVGSMVLEITGRGSVDEVLRRGAEAGCRGAHVPAGSGGLANPTVKPFLVGKR